MFPWSPEFVWDAPHVIFLGAFYAAVCVILGSVSLALFRAWRDQAGNRTEAIAWHADFEDLPRSARRCRHELRGEVKHRTCPNAFDCRACDQHAGFVARRTEMPKADDGSVYGMSFPSDRLYHRGHAWARQETDGTVTVGLDDLATRLLGVPDALELPPPGTVLVANGTALRARKGEDEIRILSPVDGTVVETGAPVAGWLLRVQPPETGLDARHLLSGAEVRAWTLRELERLQGALSADGVGPALADGGVPAEDLSGAIPPERRDLVYGTMFLEP